MKLGKQAVVLGLSTAMLLSMIPPVFADQAAPAVASNSAASGTAEDKSVQAAEAPSDVKISKDRAMELAQSYISIPSDYKLQGISYNSRNYPSLTGAWNINYEKRQQDRYYGNISVTIDSDSGKLLQYNQYENDQNASSFPPKLDWNGAKTTAGTLIDRFAPDLKDQLVYSEETEKNSKPPLNGQMRYNVKFDRVVDGIPFPQNYVMFTLDGNGKLLGYELRWDTTHLTFGSADNLLSKEQAQAAIQQKLKAELSYLYLDRSGNPANTPKPTLAYLLKTPMLDAVSGKLLNEMGNETTSPTVYKKLTDEPLAPMPKADKNLNKEQAVAAAAALIQLPAGSELTDANYYENNNERSTSSWNLSWKAAGSTDKDPDYYRASIDSRTGELLSFSHDKMMYMGKMAAAEAAAGTGKDTADKLTQEEATAKATAYIKQMLPHYSNQLAVDSNDQQYRMPDTSDMRSVSFKRLLNGIPSDTESVTVTIAGKNGEVASYWNNLMRMEAPAPETAIAEEKARELLQSQYNVELRYVIPFDQKLYYASGTPKDQKAIPVYSLVAKHPDQYLFLDAKTGEFRNRGTGAVTEPGKPAATDLNGHWAQNELQLMIDYGAIDVKNGKVSPDQAITRGEMIKMLVIARNGGDYVPYMGERSASFKDVAAGSAYFGYVEAAVDANLIDNKTDSTFRPDAQMTRDDLAELLVRALGYNKLAEHNSLFNLPASDAASIRHKGQAAILLELGIMTASNGKFLPEQEVSRAQAATTFYRYLEQRNGLRDAPIGMY